MEDLTKQQKFIIARALVNEATGIWDSIDRSVLRDTYTVEDMSMFADTGQALCDLGAVGRALKAIAKE